MYTTRFVHLLIFISLLLQLLSVFIGFEQNVSFIQVKKFCDDFCLTQLTWYKLGVSVTFLVSAPIGLWVCSVCTLHGPPQQSLWSWENRRPCPWKPPEWVWEHTFAVSAHCLIKTKDLWFLFLKLRVTSFLVGLNRCVVASLSALIQSCLQQRPDDRDPPSPTPREPPAASPHLSGKDPHGCLLNASMSGSCRQLWSFQKKEDDAFNDLQLPAVSLFLYNPDQEVFFTAAQSAALLAKSCPSF